ncbi:MAG: hypothetical protein ACRDWY_17310, partial [Actinomycetes bacterium]
MNPYDDLEPALRGDGDLVGQRLARLLRVLRRPTGDVPRASEELAMFLAAAETGAEVDSAGERLTVRSDLLVTVGSAVHGPAVGQAAGPSKRRRMMKSSLLVPLQNVAKLGLLAKVMLGATVALGGAGAVAATSTLPDNDKDVVVTSPASDDTGQDDTEEAPSAADDHEGRGLAPGDVDDEPEDEPEDELDDAPEPEDEPDHDDGEQGDHDDGDEPDHDDGEQGD